MDEYHSLGVTRSCEILIDRWLKHSYIRGKGTDTSDLQETKEILRACQEKEIDSEFVKLLLLLLLNC